MVNTARTTRVSDVTVVYDRRVMHDGRVDVGVMDNRRIHPDNRGVVGKVSTPPFTTREPRRP